MANELEKYQTSIIPTKDIECDYDWNCRPVEKMETLELAKSIKTKGLDQPILVRTHPNPEKGFKYKIVAGHRRYTAFMLNETFEIPAIIRNDITNEDAARDMNLRENLERRNLSFMEEAKALNYYFEKGFTDDQVASRLGRSPGWVTPRRRILALPDFVRREAEAGTLNQQHITKFWIFRHRPEQMKDMIARIKEGLAAGNRVVPLKDKMNLDVLTRIRAPKGHEIDDMLVIIKEMITDALPDGEENFGHRVLAWARGGISLGQLYRSMEKECKKLGIPFAPPKDIQELLSGKP